MSYGDEPTLERLLKLSQSLSTRLICWISKLNTCWQGLLN